MNRLILGLFALIIVQIVDAADFSWEVVTNTNDAKDINIKNNILYAATSGGFVIQPLSEDQYDVWTTEDGITDHNFTILHETDKEFIILGTFEGGISFFNITDQSFQEDFNLEGNEIVSIFAVEDTLWIASKNLIGVYLFNAQKQKFEFRDFFSNFQFNFTSFQDIVYHQGNIWVASDNGLIFAPGSFQKFNLKSAGSWQSMTTEDGLPSNSIFSLSVKEDTLLIGTDNGISQLIQQNFINISAGLGTRAIQHIISDNNNIWVNDSKFIYRLEGNSFTPVYSATINTINDFGVDNSGDVWVSLSEKGLKNVIQDRQIWFNGPIDNILGKIYLNRRGELWVMSGIYGDQRARGFSVLLNNGIWRNFRHLESWRPTASTQAVIEDEAGNMWIGSWNGGLTIVDSDFKFFHFNNYTSSGKLWMSSIAEDDTIVYNPPDSVRHFLSYTKNFPDLLVLTDIILDRTNRSIWLSTLSVNSNKPLIKHPYTEFTSQAFDSTSWEKIGFGAEINISNAEVAALTFDIFNNIWIGTQRDGVIAAEFNDSGGFNWFNFNENDNLKNNSCLAVAGDQDGFIWLGTLGGLNAYFNGNIFDFREDYQPIGLQILDIFVDTQNNKWFATDKGISLLKASGSPWEPNSWEHFVPQRSEIFGENIHHTNLPHETVRSVFVDDRTGDVYCSTFSGLAILRSNPFTTPLPDLTKVKVGPVPLTLGDTHTSFLYFRNLTANSEVKIMTSTGRLVRALNNKNTNEILGSFAQWDGRNGEGKFVSSGVYLYLITDEIGNATSGKFLVIRQ
jgi:ligand-binding sensor domain-containing protein